MAVENKFPGKDLTEDDIAGKIPLVAKKSPDHKTVFTCGGIEIGGPLIPVMAGPNTVENEEMIVESAKAIKAAGGHFLRGGAFKPLSFPYRSPKFFESREDGLKWLTEQGRLASSEQPHSPVPEALWSLVTAETRPVGGLIPEQIDYAGCRELWLRHDG